MTSTAANGINRAPKTNLSVASLINCSTKVSASSVEKVKSEVIVTTTITNGPKSLPTVANTDLLYKNVPSAASCQLPPPLAPALPVTATLAVNYTLQQYSNLVGGFRTSTNSNPLTNIKTLTNVVTNPLSKIEVSQQYSPKKPYVEIRPAPFAPANQKPTVLSPATLTADMMSGLVTTSNKPPIVVYSTTNLLTSANVPSTHKLKTLLAKPSPQATVQRTNESDAKAIFVPRGWNRIIEKENITYVSPNKSRLRSMEDLLDYLQQEGTCKCGLECPFKPSEVFDFNPKVQSRFGFSANGKADPYREIHCNVCRKFEELFPPAPKSKPRGRKPGVKSKRPLISAEKKPSPERKKILLTGASPLELFQTKMMMDTSSSSSFLINFPRKECNAQQQTTTHATTAPFTNITSSPQNTNAKTSLEFVAEQIINSDLNRQIITKSPRGREKGRGRGGTVVQMPDASQQKSLKKPIPNAVVHHARDIQLKEILNQVTNQNPANATKHILISQLQGLLGGHPKPDLNEISKALFTLQNKQFSTTSSGLSETQTTSILHSLEAKATGDVTSQQQKQQQEISVASSLLSTSVLNIQSQPLQTLPQGTNAVINTAQQQQMLLLQLVNQGKAVASNPVVTVVSHQQPPTMLINTTQNLTSNSTDPTMQVKGLLQQQISPLQYVVSAPPTAAFTIQQPIVQYVTQTPPATTSYVKIAPAAVQQNLIEKLNPLEEEHQKQERALLESMQEHLTEKNLSTEKVYETLPAAGEFLSTVASKQFEEEEVIRHEEMMTEESTTSINNDEMFLHCDESVSDREENCLPKPNNKGINSNSRVVWVHLPGFPMWPAKIMTYREAGQPKLDDGEVYISMYLTQQVHAVSQTQLNPFDAKLAKEEWDYSEEGENEREAGGSDIEKAIREAIIDASCQSLPS